MNGTITIAEFAQRLNVSRMTIHRMRTNGELPDPIKTNRRFVRFLESDVALWFELGNPNAANFKRLKRTKQRLAKNG